MVLTTSTRQDLQAHLGCTVVDIREAPDTTTMVLAPVLSLGATSILSEMFPRAQVVTCRYLDDQHPTDLPAFSVATTAGETSLSAA